MASPEKQANNPGGLPAGAQFIVQNAGDQQGAQQVIQLGQGGQRIQLAGGAQSIQLAGGAQNIQLAGGQRIQLTTATGQRIVLPQQGISQQILQQLQKQSGGQRIVVQQPGQQQPQIVLQPGTSVQKVVNTQQQQPQPATTVQQQQQKLILQQQKAQQKLLQQQILQKQQQQQQQQQLQKQQQPAQPGTQTIRVVAPQGQQVIRPATGMQVLQIQQPGGQGVQKIIISKEQLQQLQMKGNLGQQIINLQQGEVKATTSQQGQQILVRPQQVQKVQQIQVAQQLPAGKLNKPKTVAEHVAQAQAQKTVTVQQMLKGQQSPLKQGTKPILVQASSGQQILTTATMQSPVRSQQQVRAVASPVRAATPQAAVRSVTPAQLMQNQAKAKQQKVVVSTTPNQLPRSVVPAPAQNIVVSSAPVQVTTQPGKTLNIMAARPKAPATSINTNAQTLQTMTLVNTVPTTPDSSAAKKGLKTILPTPAAPKAQQITKSLLPGQQQAIQPKTSKAGVASTATVLTTTTTGGGGGTPRVISLVPSQPGVTSSATRAALATAGTSAVKQALGGVSQTEAMAVGVEEVEVTDSGAPPARVVHTSPIKTREHQKAKQKAAKHRRQQDKANQIILEAIKKAKEEGRELPPHIEPLPTDSTLELTTEDGEPRRKKEKKAKKDKRDRPHKEKVDKPKPLKKKSTKAKKPIPDSLLAKRERRKRRQEEIDDASDGEMAHIVEKAHTRKFYVPPDIDDECKRRSSRNTKRRKYNDEVELPSDHTSSSSSDENVDVDDTGIPEKNSKKKKSSASKKKKKKEQVLQHSESSHQSSVVQDGGAVEEENVVEKILGMRLGSRTRPRADVDLDILNYDDIEIPQETVQLEEYYVKYRNFSYLHCEWKTEEELLKGDKRIPQKIRRFKTHKLPFMDPYLHDEEDLFNQDYLEIDRVLDKAVTYEPPDNEMVIHYLVKWRSLPYEEATWELEQDVDNELIERWNINQIMPPENERAAIARPRAYKWTKINKSPVYRNENTLREYQLEGLNWLSFCYHNKQNCILADEMGLGKTIQSITFLKTVFDYGIKGPFLVIVPLSTLANWQREFDLWTNMNAVTYHGTSASRRMIQDYELYFRDDKLNIIPDIYKFHAMITTYEIIISDVELLSSIEWRVVIIDEAHRLKNKNCKLAEGLGYFDMEHRVLLTGTPLQNNTEELFSLLNFLEPSRFNNLDEFLKDFGELRTESQVKQLKSLLKPMMLRRLKEDVEKSLAPKEETIVEVEMTNTQKKFYRAILERNFTYLAKGGTSANVPNLMNTMMELRKCCNHPYLIDGAESRVIQEHRERYGDRADTALKALVQSCGKMVLLDKLLPRLYADKHRVLIFSQMIRVLDILEDYVVQKGYLYERLDGRIRGNHRQEAIDRFSKKDSDRFIFLLCTRAGGLGINLTAADTVVIYDSDWNPQNDLQAQARCHRIGQKKAVKMYRLITRNSYEREMFDKASMKLGLDKALLQSNTKQGDGEEGKAQLSKREIEDLLKKGAYGAIMDDEKAGDAFCEEDIDLILARRTQVIQVESEGKGSTFAKASFSASGNRDDIDIDDPEFWDKWAKKADIDTDGATTQLIVEEPRRRKQTARYGGQDTLTNMSELETSDSDSDKDKKSKKKEKERDEKDLDVEDPDDKEKRKKEKKKQVKRRRKKEKEQQEEEQKPQPLPRETGYVRSEMFKVEKNMMVFGYGRWDDIHLHARFRRRIYLDDVEEIAKALLLYSLRYYAGDERIKRFIYDLVNPKEDVDIKNHTGLSAPVPRGRKGKKTVEEASQQSTDELEAEIAAQCGIDPEKILGDEGYKKHLQRHANKVLLRVRLLYYLKQEVIGNDNADMITAGVNHEIIDLPPVSIDNNVKPCDWWDDDADKSLLIGVFKHGYEKFHAIRQDPCLCFLERCGPPDGTALAREQNDEDDFLEPEVGKAAEQQSKRPAHELDEDREDGELRDDEDSQGEGDKDRAPAEPAQDGKFPFPSFSDLNTRFRRVITSYQKIHKRALHKMAKHEKKRERIEAVTKEREQKKRDSQQRWSRREEMDFYRIVSSYGVEYNTEEKGYRWDKFRTLARLEKKYDDTMTDYFLAFYFMCCCVCKRLAPDAPPPNDLTIEPITEERANRCLARIDLLNKIREETLRHPELDDRLRLCEYGHDLPDWWEPGKHDKELLKGAARHGLARTDFHILHDPDLLFKEIVQNKSMYVPPKPDPDGETSNSRRGGDSSDDENYSHDRPVLNGQVIKVESGMELHEVADRGSSAEDGAPQAPPHGERKPFSVKEMVAKIKAEAAAKMGKFPPPPYGGHPGTPGTPGRDEDLENEAHEPTVAELLAKNVAPAVQWPKDRTVFHRLEQVCTCVDKNEWPTMRRNQGYGMTRDLDGSYGSTPTGTPRPSGRGDTPLGDGEEWGVQVGGKNDGLKLTIGKRKYRSKKLTFEEAMRGEQYGDSDSDLAQMYKQMKGSPGEKKKRGRKSKVEKMILEAQARHEAVERMMMKAQRRLQGFDDPDFRVPVVNHENGDRLSGDEAPLRRYVASWLNKNPGYTIDLPYDPEDELDSKWTKKPRRHKIDPAKLDWDNLTGEENVSVVNTVTGKRVTGAKAPELRYLARFLEHNPNYNVDSKWAHLVRTKANLPERYLGRILSPASEKPGSPRVPSHTHPLMQSGASKMLGATPLLNVTGLNPAMVSNLYGMQLDDSKNEEAIKALVKAAQQQKAQQQQGQLPVVVNQMVVNQLGSKISLPSGSNIPTQITTSMTMAEAQAALKNGIIFDGGKILKASPPGEMLMPSQSIGIGSLKKVGGKTTISVSPRSILKPKPSQPQVIRVQPQPVVKREESLIQPAEIVIGGMETVCNVQDVPDVSYSEEIPMQVTEEVVTEETPTTTQAYYHQEVVPGYSQASEESSRDAFGHGENLSDESESSDDSDDEEEESRNVPMQQAPNDSDDDDDSISSGDDDEDDDVDVMGENPEDDDDDEVQSSDFEDDDESTMQSRSDMMMMTGQSRNVGDEEDDGDDSSDSDGSDSESDS